MRGCLRLLVKSSTENMKQFPFPTARNTTHVGMIKNDPVPPQEK